jgi:hypothetical protein
MSKRHAVKAYRGVEENVHILQLYIELIGFSFHLRCFLRKSPGTNWIRSQVNPRARLEVAM